MSVNLNKSNKNYINPANNNNNSQISSVIVATGATPKSIDKDLWIFQAYAQYLRDAYPQSTHAATFPLIDWIASCLNTLIYEITTSQPKYIPSFLPSDEEPSDGFYAVQRAIYLALADFKLTKNPESLLRILEKGKQAIEKEKSIERESLWVKDLEPIILLLKTKRIDLLSQNSLSFLSNENNSLTKQIAFSSAQEALPFMIIHYDTLIINADTLGSVLAHYLKPHSRKSWDFREKNQQSIDGLPELAKSFAQDRLSSEEAALIKNAFKNISYEFFEESNCGAEYIIYTASRHFDETFLKTVHIPQNFYFAIEQYMLSRNIAFKTVSQGNLTQTYKPKNDIIKQCSALFKSNQEAYLSLLPKIQEICIYFDNIKKVIQLCTVIKDFHLYLKFGDLEPLRQKLSDGYDPDQLKKVLIEQVTLFSQALRTDHNLLIQVIPFLQKESFIKEFRSFCVTQDTFYNTIIELRKTILDSMIPLAEMYGDYMSKFLEDETIASNNAASLLQSDKGSSQRKNKKEKAKNILPSMAAVANSGHIPAETTTKIADGKSEIDDATPTPIPVALSPLQPMQKARDNMQQARSTLKSNLRNLSVACTKDKTKQAVANALIHYDEILCVMRRFLEQSTQPQRQPIAHFILNCVEQGFLAAEQMLTALELESNQSDNQALTTDDREQPAARSHDLHSIFIKCRLPGGPLSLNLRDWIRKSSRVEFEIRDLKACEIKEPTSQNLLAKTNNYFAHGNNAFTSQSLIEEAMLFVKNSVNLCEYLQNQLYATKQKPSNEQKLLFKSVTDGFRLACQSVMEVAELLPASFDKSTPSHPMIASLHQILQEYGTSPSKEIQYRAKDIAENSLPYLETELQMQSHLNPYEARLHLGFILRRCQWAAEKTLRALLNETDTRFERDNHDLTAMVTALGMAEKDFTPAEWNWLSSGKAVHFLARYFSSLGSAPNNKLEKAFEAAYQISQTQPLNADYGANEGFMIAGTEKQLAEVKAMAKEHLELLYSILKKISPKSKT